jgi:hypothetical protein
MVTDGAGGIIVTWEDFRYQPFVADIFAQRLDGGGVALWAEDGVAISTAADWQWIPELVADGIGGAIVAWEDYRDGGSQYEEVYAQRIGADGELGVPTAVGRSPAHGSSLSAHPNPFGARTVIDYDAAGATTEISIYDVRGRHVRTLVEGRTVAHAGSVAWDGTGARGEKVPAGVYFVRMVSGAHEVTRRIVLLR